MDVVLRRGNLATRAVGAVAVGVLEGEKKLTGAAAAVDRATGKALTAVLATGDFRGRLLETAVAYPSRGRAKRVILVGLGPSAELDEHRARQAAAAAAGKARALRAGSLATIAMGAGAGGLEPLRAAHVSAEGAVLGHYRFTAYRTQPDTPPLKRIEFVEHDAKRAGAMKEAVARGAAWGEAACVSRDLASTPGQDLTPADLAQKAKEIGRVTGVRVRAFGVPELERLGAGALLAVGRGSIHPPKLIVLEYEPEAKGRGAKKKKSANRPVVVIGKGVTFDTGGISLKPGANMQKMKYDMSGSAAVLGLFHALPSIRPPFPVIGLIPTAENMPDGAAFKPGDVLRAIDGTTIEVTNTDAEGRLILADALAYARRNYEPRAVVDLATLTGAITIALGGLAAGMFTPDDSLAAELDAASAASGERLWRLPLYEEYLQQMKSDTADLQNSGGREGGSITAALFLKHFAGDMRWAHLDIASTSWATGDRPHEPRGPSGFGARLLLEWVHAQARANEG